MRSDFALILGSLNPALNNWAKNIKGNQIMILQICLVSQNSEVIGGMNTLN